MALKIRLRQQGRTNARTYRVVLIDGRAQRDGAYLETLGHYNPTDRKNAQVNAERVSHWLALGAELSEGAAQIVAIAAPQVVAAQKAKVAAKKAAKRAKAA